MTDASSVSMDVGIIEKVKIGRYQLGVSFTEEQVELLLNPQYVEKGSRWLLNKALILGKKQNSKKTSHYCEGGEHPHTSGHHHKGVPGPQHQ